jgi:signal transduction histidine kinase
MTAPAATGETSVEDQAHRIAAQLHDGAMQEVTLARLQLDLLSSSMPDDPALVAQVANLSRLLQEVSTGLQELLRTLAPDLGIV